MVEQTKVCTKCNEEKLLSQFYGDKRATDSKTSRCRVCCNQDSSWWAKRHPEFTRRQNARISTKVRKCRDNARRRSIPWELTNEQAARYLEGECVYCGEASAGGIDRRDSSVGYLEDNCVPCCWECNRMKNSFTVDEWFNKMRNILIRQEVQS